MHRLGNYVQRKLSNVCSARAGKATAMENGLKEVTGGRGQIEPAGSPVFEQTYENGYCIMK